jgi:putative oxidoreductase
MSYGLLLLRVAVGLTFAAHGAQKLFGWFGGPGMQGAAGFVRSLGFRPPTPWVWLLALAEFFGGLGLAFGLLTPLVALVLAIDMLVAIWTVHWQNGFFAGNGGLEFPLALGVAATALAFTGPGRFSIDRAIGWDDETMGVWWGVGVGATALAAAVLILALGRTQPRPAEAPKG